jgi:hypothetical protein
LDDVDQLKQILDDYRESQQQLEQIQIAQEIYEKAVNESKKLNLELKNCNADLTTPII